MSRESAWHKPSLIGGLVTAVLFGTLFVIENTLLQNKKTEALHSAGSAIADIIRGGSGPSLLQREIDAAQTRVYVFAGLTLLGLVLVAASRMIGSPGNPSRASHNMPSGHAEQLSQLAALREQGILSEAEFTAKKNDILRRM